MRCRRRCLILAAGFTEGTTQAMLWIVALALDFSGPYVFGVRGFKDLGRPLRRALLPHPDHRPGRIDRCDRGGIAGAEIDTGLVVAAVLVMVLTAAMWWAYFDVVAVVAERHFSETEGYLRAKMARDSYSYLHLFMVAGIVLVALGIKKTVADVDEPLKQVPAAALFGGLALYYGGHVAFRWRNVHSINRQRVVVALRVPRAHPVRHRGRLARCARGRGRDRLGPDRLRGAALCRGAPTRA